MLSVHSQREQRAWAHERCAGSELELLREERGEATANSDKNFLDLRTFSDVERVARHRGAQRAEDILSLNLKQGEDIGILLRDGLDNA